MSRRAAAAGGLAVVATLLSGSTAEAFTQSVHVTTTADSGPGSLRAGIIFLNAYTGPNTITFQSGLSGSIDLASSLPAITSPLTITGPGARTLAINGDGDQIFDFSAGAADTVAGLTLTGANDGAVYSAGPTVTLNDVTVSGNQSTYGGGVDARGPLNINGSTISGNSAQGGGGVDASVGLSIVSSTVAGNAATEFGGGGIVIRGGALLVEDSTISGNTANANGGGIDLRTDVSAVTSAMFENSIVARNSAVTSPDISNETGLGGVVPTATFSLIGNTSGSGITPDSTDIVGKDPLLGPLANNGGPTDTMLPADNSPVIDQGKAFGATEDQRGLPRPVDLPGYPNAPGGDGSDIGSVELQPAEVLPAIGGLSVSSGPAGTSVVLTGTHLASATKVLFGSTAAKFTVNSDTQITGIAPAGSGAVDVRVVSPGGESAPVAVDKFTYKASPPASQTTTGSVGDQQLALTTPSAKTCTAAARGLPVKFTSTSSSKSKGTKLKFSNAAFYIDRGIRHTHKQTKRLKNGKRKRVTVVKYLPNAIIHHVPSTLSIKLTGQKSGRHTLKVIVSYREKVTKHHRKLTVTVSKTLKVTFEIC